MNRQLGIVAQEGHQLDDAVALAVQRQLAEGDVMADGRAAALATIAWPRASSASKSSFGAEVAIAQRSMRAGAADFPLQLQDAVDQGLGGGRAARHVDVDRHDAVAAAHHGIGVVVIAAAIGAGPIEIT